MIIDSSAILAVLYRESDAVQFGGRPNLPPCRRARQLCASSTPPHGTLFTQRIDVTTIGLTFGSG